VENGTSTIWLCQEIGQNINELGNRGAYLKRKCDFSDSALDVEIHLAIFVELLNPASRSILRLVATAVWVPFYVYPNEPIWVQRQTKLEVKVSKSICDFGKHGKASLK
jgi:hypothetical protein